MKHWKQQATECAVPGCTRQRVKGWTTCAVYQHHEAGKPLAGLAPGANPLKFQDVPALVPGRRNVMELVDFEFGPFLNDD